MKKILIVLLISSPSLAMAQIGVKAGWNFTNVTSVASVNSKSASGFNVGAFFTTPYRNIIGNKTELIYSKQGYNYSTGSATGKVNLEYIMLPSFICINITKFFQIYAGEEMAYLINANADSTSSSNSGMSGSYNQILSYYNRFQFALGGGVEVHPISGLLVGARFNFSLTNLYSMPSSNSSSEPPSFVPNVNVKSNLFQIYAGWKFGK
ncbi:MAG TPA: outer membrane beta-barrel protein [Puia sp.]|jgi:opacity protein-like surface antigen|nr:outer membrane beta-barrel protein [Puia sp.]